MSAQSKSRSGRLNLEQQKKRAKELVRAHRQRAAEAAARIISSLPRARNSSQAEVLKQSFSLSEAQLVVAREAGFESWPSMKRETELVRRGIDSELEALVDAALAGNSAAQDHTAARRSLHLACALGDAEAALTLLDQDPGRVNDHGGLRNWSPLFYVCSARHGRGNRAVTESRLRIVKRLLELGADPNEEVESHGSPGGFRSVLQNALRGAGSVELVDALLNANAALQPTGGAAGPVLPLTDAVYEANIACVERLLRARPPLWELREALEAAIEQDSAELCRLLLDNGAHANAAGRWWGQQGSCLHAAILLGRGETLLQELLASEVDIHATDRDRRTPYAIAVRTGHAVASELLRQRGASDTELDDVDRLIAACVAENRERAEALIEANPTLETCFRRTDHQVLCWAIRHQRYGAVPLLLEWGLDPNIADDHGETPLHLAASAGHAATIAALEAAGASRNARNFHGRKPFDEITPENARSERDALFEAAVKAVVDGDLEALRELLDEEPDLVHARSPRVHRATLLHYVAANGVERQETPKTAAAIAELLLERGADVDALAHTYGGGPGQTTLNLTTTSAYPEQAGLMDAIVQALVRGGANVNGLDGEGGPLHGAIGEGRRSAVAALLRAGARIPNLFCAAATGRLELVESFAPEASSLELKAAFMAAASFDQAEVLASLIDRGVDVATEDDQKFTALHWAAWHGSMKTIELLIERCAPLEARNIYGGTVLGTTVYASVHGGLEVDYAPVIEKLCAAGARTDAFGGTFTGIAAVDEVLRRYGFVPRE